ncbi:MAG: OmpW family protein [Cyanothece sp. SIO2G6]|nr:OmpW family protein [Cyanothece sp. SIO2G6]
MNFKLFFCSVFLSFLGCGSLLSNSAAAQEFKPKEAGDFLIRIRGLAVIPREGADLSLDDLSISGGADIDNAYVPEIDFSYFISDHIALELIAAVTIHDVEAEGTPLGDLDLGEVGLVPPTLTVQYHFRPDRRLSPYLGTGLNYTFFFDEADGDATDIDYDNSFGFALQAGVDYAIADRWSLNADVKKIFLNTEADIEAAGLNIEADIEVNPWIIGVGVGYRF